MKSPAWLAVPALAAAFYLCHYELFLRRLPNTGAPRAASAEASAFPELTLQDSLDLGRAHRKPDAPPHSYLHFQERKRPGTLRIGVFGDGPAGTSGDPLSAWGDRLFRASHRDVEVVDFRLPGCGLHQAYLLWSKLGVRYDLDDTVFLLREKNLKADGSFAGSGSLHARYVLEGGRLRLIHVRGGSLAEAASLYYRIIPPWRYLHYDAAPPFLRQFLPADGSGWVNPLYYWPPSERQREAAEISARIFRDVIARSKRLVVFSDSAGLIYFFRTRFLVPGGRIYQAASPKDPGLAYGVAVDRLPPPGNGADARKLLEGFAGAVERVD